MRNLFLSNRFILVLIALNAAIIFALGFPLEPMLFHALTFVDQGITVLFIVEMIIKIGTYGWKAYIRDNWNRMDFILILLSAPSLLLFAMGIDSEGLGYLLVFRLTRMFKTFRSLKFIPGIDGLIVGVKRALKASVIVLFGFGVYIFLVAILCFHLFRETAPEYFHNPLSALYSTFKIFTVEGWYEIPEHITAGMGPEGSIAVLVFFIFILLTGGIFGLSLVNSIFVDAMVADNTDALEAKVDALQEKVDRLLFLLAEAKDGAGQR